MQYSERKGYKWLTMLVGFFLLGIGGWFLMPVKNMLQHSLYDRTGLESICREKFGTTKINEILTDEIMIVSYDFRNHKPIIFTRYAAQ